MASVTKQNDGNDAMADEASSAGGRSNTEISKPVKADLAEGDDERSEASPYRAAGAASGKHDVGFFTIYKSGQGYWTRMGTVIGAILLLILTAQFLYEQGRVWFKNAAGQTRQSVVLAMVGIFAAVYAFIVYRVLNRPRVAEFLIATDSEMKKVNWTSRKELIGSTKVVIMFMILISLILFVFDTVFAEVFHWIGVLLVGPFDH